MSPRGGRWERIAVRLNAILRKVPKERSLDGKTWHAETSARRSLMRYIVGVVARLIEEEDERENDRHLAEQRLPDEGTTIPAGVLKPGDTIDIRVTNSSGTQVLPVERILSRSEEEAIGIRRAPLRVEEDRASTQGPDVRLCDWCSKILPTSGSCPCLPF